MARRVGTINHDTIFGTSLSDEIFGLAGNDILNGLAGDDEIFGGAGNDTIDGSVGNDELYGEDGNDLIRGGEGNDDLIGGAGSDTLLGGNGDDQFVGGLGRDIMTGHAGKSEYVYNSIAESTATLGGRDLITDFKHLIDDIDLRLIDANTRTATNDAFVFRGTAGFTGVAGQLMYFQVDRAGTATDITIIQADVNGDRVADFQIELTGLKTLTADDFNL